MKLAMISEMSTHIKDKPVKGWLKRKGRMNTWCRRWFILTDKLLIVFLRNEDKKTQDCINLNKQIIVEPPCDSNDPRNCYFDIVTEHESGRSETLSLCAETEEEKQIWVRALKRALYADKGGAVFCQSLEEILYWEHLAGRKIPYIMDECVEYLYKYGLDREGIFRLPGNQTLTKSIVARFEQGEKIKFEEEGTDVHVVASVLKTFLRSLPDSLIPCSNFQKFMSIALHFKNEEEDEARDACVQELAEAIKFVPHCAILKYICRFLREVERHSSKNKMSVMRLSVEFSYFILRHLDKDNSKLFLLTADIAQNLLYMLLNYYGKVFNKEYNTRKDERKAPSADLLRMSRTIDIPAILPISSIAQSDGAGLSASSSTNNGAGSSGSQEVSTGHILVDEHGVNITEYDFDAFKICSTSGTQNEMHCANGTWREKKRSVSELANVPSSSSSRDDFNILTMSPGQRVIRRHSSMKKRPAGIVVEEDEELPQTILSLRDVDSKNVLTGHTEASFPSPSLPMADSGASCISISQDKIFSETASGALSAFETVNKEKSERLLLINKIAALKKELFQKRDSHRMEVAAVRAQITDMEERHNHEIKILQDKFRKRIKELESELIQEQESRAASVADSVRLQEEIAKYRMLCGELS